MCEIALPTSPLGLTPLVGYDRDFGKNGRLDRDGVWSGGSDAPKEQS